MPRVVRKWRGDVRRLLDRSILHLSSLLQRDIRFKAKDPEAGIFTETEITTLQTAIGVLDDTAEETVTR